MIQAGDYQKEFMKNSNFIFQITIFLLSISILLTGCHSFYEVPKDDYSNLEKMNDIKVVYKNGKEFVIEKDDTTNVKIVRDSLIVFQGTNIKSIGMSEVEKIRESRFDLGGTITISIVAVTFFLVLFLSANPFKT
ncbi:MAG: hypothetical protein IH620_05595 [Ignavibacterium sp.]|nr:hypothetical protein [Ignavibacterium sp.]